MIICFLHLLIQVQRFNQFFYFKLSKQFSNWKKLNSDLAVH